MQVAISVVLTTGLLFLSLCLGQERPTVNIKAGVLEGVNQLSRSGRNFSAFLGIPYANAPTRFKVAEPMDPWQGVRQATTLGNVCLQKLGPTIAGSEDCLFLNAYSPNLLGELPVLAYIHGGAYMVGSSADGGPDFLMDKDIVFVTMNYRLGPLGFLSTGDGELEANLGLKDTLIALQWIQTNIRYFGGDASKVSIMGGSAGATMVHYHILSPLSRGLFSQAILQSASALSPFAFDKHPEKIAFGLGDKLNCATRDSKMLLGCLEKLNATDILSQDLTEWFLDPSSPFAPSFDVPGKSVQNFIPDSPENILNSGNFNKVPALFTVCEDEGIILHAISINRSEVHLKEMNENSSYVFPITFYYDVADYTDREENFVTAEIKNFYFGTKYIGGDTFQDLTNLYSDRSFVNGVQTSATIHAKNNISTFIGVFAYKGEFSFTRLLMGIEEVIGVTHGDDSLYLFNRAAIQLNAADTVASQCFVAHIAQFVGTGNPGPICGREDGLTWPPLELSQAVNNNLAWIRIDLTPTFLQNPFKERNEFWSTIFEKAKSAAVSQLATKTSAVKTFLFLVFIYSCRNLQ